MDSADLQEALAKAEPIIVVDGRSASAYGQEHFPGAMSLLHIEISADSTGSLDRSKLYVCYCDGIGCNALTKTALKLLTLGIQVRELIGGLDWWERDGYETQGNKAASGNGADCGCN